MTRRHLVIGLGGLLALGVALFLQRSFAHRQPTQIEGNQA